MGYDQSCKLTDGSFPDIFHCILISFNIITSKVASFSIVHTVSWFCCGVLWSHESLPCGDDTKDMVEGICVALGGCLSGPTVRTGSDDFAHHHTGEHAELHGFSSWGCGTWPSHLLPQFGKSCGQRSSRETINMVGCICFCTHVDNFCDFL